MEILHRQGISGVIWLRENKISTGEFKQLKDGLKTTVVIFLPFLWEGFKSGLISKLSGKLKIS